MHIGITYDLKPTQIPVGSPDDLHEEFDAPETIDAIVRVLEGLGHTVTKLGNGAPFLRAVLDHPPTLIFNFAEGIGVSRNRESRVPAVCEMLGIPYTGSDAFTMALALDKDWARRVVSAEGVRIPQGVVLQPPPEGYDGTGDELPAVLAEAGLAYPVLAKPTCEGSSKGIRNRCLIEQPDQLGRTVQELWQSYHQPVLIEEFIAGDEVTVGILGNDPPEILGAMRVVPKQPTERFVYSLEVKRNYKQHVDYECPPQLPAAVLSELEQTALLAYEALGCRDVARIDFRIRAGEVYFLEANPLPGLNPIHSDLVLIGKAVHKSHAEIVQAILASACRRHGLPVEC